MRLPLWELLSLSSRVICSCMVIVRLYFLFGLKAPCPNCTHSTIINARSRAIATHAKIEVHFFRIVEVISFTSHFCFRDPRLQRKQTSTISCEKYTYANRIMRDDCQKPNYTKNSKAKWQKKS